MPRRRPCAIIPAGLHTPLAPAVKPLDDFPPAGALREAVRDAYLLDEAQALRALIPAARLAPEAAARRDALGRRLVQAVRSGRRGHGGLDALLREYDLSSQEGVVLMCLAEALLRIPDAATADALIRDRLGGADWARHLGHSESLLVNASTWGLLLTGRMVRLDTGDAEGGLALLRRLVARSGDTPIRLALREAMRILSQQFVIAPTIEAALARARERGERWRYSFDMLGEAALSRADAQHHLASHRHALAMLGRGKDGAAIEEAPSLSVKLSALHPRFELAQHRALQAELVPQLAALVAQARSAGVGITLDTEEAERLEPTLDVFEAVFEAASLAGWNGFGIAVQAYQKRAPRVLDWLADLARRHRRRIPLRLVKGAYWDTEIKRAQERGLAGYPVFTRKAATDVSYLACARALLDAPEAFYPQFATHNAHTAASVIEMAGDARNFELQRLHGMGEALHTELTDPRGLALPCRIYAPVGSHRELLPYLVRRLLENGANTSFVNRIVDEQVPIETVLADPVAHIVAPAGHAQRIALPLELYPDRRNSQGVNLHDPQALRALGAALRQAGSQEVRAAPCVDGRERDAPARAVHNPARHGERVGVVHEADATLTTEAIASAARAAPEWASTSAELRAGVLERAADALEEAGPALMALCIREGGKCIGDALGEVREAADACRYYALLARRQFGAPRLLFGPTGERNELSLHGRGVFACISPWNFPLAIFTGQIAAALVAGNAVVAKPATHTPLVAARAVALLHAAGVPGPVLQFLPGRASTLGATLATDPRICGIAVTGSTATARDIQLRLAQRNGPIVPLIAETGGQNAMIVDSSALPEQVVADALQSAFNSAGQRCSALRVLFLQQEIAPRVLELLRGAMAELRVGDPALLATDVGPVIDAGAQRALHEHRAALAGYGRLLCEATLPLESGQGTFFAPCAFEIDSPARLQHEVFGPVLHVVRYAQSHLGEVIDAVNATGYGLTLGIHTRIEATAREIQRRVRVGNTYVNRNMIGAVVGVQPFGGEGLSGTGPKAGGPNYLRAFSVERTYTVNTAALGGNTELLGLGDPDRPQM